MPSPYDAPHPGPARPLRTRAPTREPDRARHLLPPAAGTPPPADTEAATAVLARLTTPLPAQRAPAQRAPAQRAPAQRAPAQRAPTARTLAERALAERRLATARDQRLQRIRILRTTPHHLDAGAVSPPAAALLAAVVRALLPWPARPDPPPRPP
ncbi:hypothetical protein FSY75_38040, partial [Streptomyces sp. TR1341]|nr:hypothetical protein [Streptomyces sp. TR1341]